MPRVFIYDNNQELVKEAALKTIKVLKNSIDLKNNALWCLAGGNSPVEVYKYIAKNFYSSIDWQKVFFILGDERCVPDNNEDSNVKVVKDTLLSLIKTDTAKVLLPKYSFDKDKMAKMYNQDLKELLARSRTNQIDLMYLGLGEDGHTLSLFPGNDAVKDKHLVTHISNSPKPPKDRISLTYNALTYVEECFIFASGENKRNIYSRLNMPSQNYPINAAIRKIESTGGSVNWLIDEGIVKN